MASIPPDKLAQTYTHTSHYQIDYILIPARWRNAITNVEADPYSDTTSDHNPLRANMQVKLKALKKTQSTPSTYYAEPTVTQSANYNRSIKQALTDLVTHAGPHKILDIIKTVAETQYPILNKRKKN